MPAHKRPRPIVATKALVSPQQQPHAQQQQQQQQRQRKAPGGDSWHAASPGKQGKHRQRQHQRQDGRQDRRHDGRHKDDRHDRHLGAHNAHTATAATAGEHGAGGGGSSARKRAAREAGHAAAAGPAAKKARSDNNSTGPQSYQPVAQQQQRQQQQRRPESQPAAAPPPAAGDRPVAHLDGPSHKQAKQLARGQQKQSQPKQAGRNPGSHESEQQQAQQQQQGGQPAAAAPPPPASTVAAKPSSNWEALRARIGATGEGAKRRQEREKAAARKPRSMGSNTGVTPVVALDCEMVGVGPDGVRSALARVAVVNQEGNTLLDVFVRPKERVTDFRTKHSGVRPSDVMGPNCVELEEAQARVAALLKGRTLVGHGLSNDLGVLLLDHPRKDIRDTAKYPPLMRSPGPGRKLKARALRHLASEQLGLDIQEGEHSPVDDARAAMYIYLKHKKEWEHALATGSLKRSVQAVKQARRTALAAATQLAAAAGAGTGVAAGLLGAAPAGAAGPAPTAAAAAKSVLSGAQLRALRTGRGIKQVMRGAAAAAAPAGATGSNAAAAGDGAAAGSKRRGAGAGARKAGGGRATSMTFDADEVAELVAAAVAVPAAGDVGGKGRSTRGRSRSTSMAEVLTRDVRLDPLADL